MEGRVVPRYLLSPSCFFWQSIAALTSRGPDKSGSLRGVGGTGAATPALVCEPNGEWSGVVQLGVKRLPRAPARNPDDLGQRQSAVQDTRVMIEINAF